MTDLRQKNHKSSPLSLTPVDYELQSASGGPNDKICLRTSSGAFLEISGVGLSRPAAFNQGSGGYVTFVKITSAVPFFIKPVGKRQSLLRENSANREQSQVTSGPAAGTQGLVLQRTGHFRFLDLPVEVRSIIFGYLVTTGSPIKLRASGDRHHGKATQASGRRFCYHEMNGKDNIRDALSLLRVSRQIHDEVFPVLYGSNHFWLSGPALHFLVNRNPKVAAHLARISLYVTASVKWIGGNIVKDGAVRRLRHSLAQLQRLSAIRSVRIHHQLISNTEMYKDPVDFVNLCVPLLNGVYRQRVEERIKTDMQDVIDIDHETCNQGSPACLEFSEQVKHEVAKRFLVDFEDEG